MLENPLIAFLPEDQANLVLMMLITVPLSYIFSFIYNKYLFLAMTMALTIGFQSILFPTDRWILWGQQQLVYLLVIFSPRKYVGHIVIVESFVAMTLLHARRLYFSYGTNDFDISGIFMMQLFNYIGLGYNYQNGAKPLESLSPEQAQRRVVQKPNYITYLGYVNFLPACLVGPVYQYTDFQNYLNKTGDYAHIPNTLTATIKEGGVFIFSLGLYGLTSFFPISRIAQTAFAEYNLGYKFVYCVVCITHIELKYVVAWSLAMMGMRASGITYNPNRNVKKPDGTIISYDFGRIEVNNMSKFYLDPNIKVKADNWNISFQWSLRRYVYENLYNPKDYPDQKTRKQRQAKAQLYTVLVSALWHGIYAGYYISFVHWVLYIQISQEIYSLKRIQGSVVHRFHRSYPTIYDTIENLFSTFTMTYFGVAFHLMVWSHIWIYLTQTLFLPYIILYIFFFLIVQMKILRKSKPKSEDKDKETLTADGSQKEKKTE